MSNKKRQKKFSIGRSIERIGLWYLVKLAEDDERKRSIWKLNKLKAAGLPLLPTSKRDQIFYNQLFVSKKDKDIASAFNWITGISMLLGFIAGGISAAASVYIDEMLRYLPTLDRLTIVFAATIGFTTIELLFLGWISVHSAYLFSRMLGYNARNIQEKLFLDEQVGILLSRAALELPDPVLHYLGVDPLSHVSKRKVLFMGILYKLKVFLSNLFARIILGKILGSYVNFGSGMTDISIAYVTVLITGIWNAVVIYKVYQEMSLRLLGAVVARQMAVHLKEIIQEKGLSPEGKEACLRAVSNSVTLTQNYHPNMLALLAPINRALGISTPKDLTNWSRYLMLLHFIPEYEKKLALKILSISAAFDGKISELERKSASEAFGDDKDFYFDQMNQITNSLRKGRLSETKRLCDLRRIR